MIVLDSSVLIGSMFEKDAHHAASVRLLREAAGKSLGVATVTMAECLVLPARSGRLHVAVQMLRDLDIVEIAMASDAATQLAQLRADTGLKMPDVCVLLAATQVRGIIATFDARLSAAAEAQGIPTVS